MLAARAQVRAGAGPAVRKQLAKAQLAEMLTCRRRVPHLRGLPPGLQAPALADLDGVPSPPRVPGARPDRGGLAPHSRRGRRTRPRHGPTSNRTEIRPR
ncbi:MAG: hypothetical protein U5R31_06255 [Acidimicrobiia bacterium]|nr:hypothetical protein [Acidimicrobiia bacterium]